MDVKFTIVQVSISEVKMSFFIYLNSLGIRQTIFQTFMTLIHYQLHFDLTVLTSARMDLFLPLEVHKKMNKKVRMKNVMQISFVEPPFNIKSCFSQ